MDIQLISKRASNIYRKYGTVDPFKVADEKGYLVIKQKMPIKLKGYTTSKNRITFIYINNLYSENEQIFTCLHELGHIFCGHDSNVIFTSTKTLFVDNKYENEANLFATSMIMQQYIDFDFYGLTLSQISCKTGIDEKYLELYYNKIENSLKGFSI